MVVTHPDGRWPDFLLIGAPKAGTSALHAGLAQHPGLRLSVPKEPKYFMCGDAPPPFYCGPGDAHSRREWIWRRRDYTGLFANMPPDLPCGESTPFYLFDSSAQRRIAETIPEVKLVAVLRDPVDRAYSNWMHLWVDGLEPVPDLVEACRREQHRIDSGWAPFWRYVGLGKYGAQIRQLRRNFADDQILIMRYRDIVDDPAGALDKVCRFIGVKEGVVTSIPRDNTKPFLANTPRTRGVGKLIRAGAWVGATMPPHIWRRTSERVLAQVHKGGGDDRPELTAEQRRRLIDYFRDDIALLSEQTGQDFGDWLRGVGAGGYAARSRNKAS